MNSEKLWWNVDGEIVMLERKSRIQWVLKQYGIIPQGFNEMMGGSIDADERVWDRFVFPNNLVITEHCCSILQ